MAGKRVSLNEEARAIAASDPLASVEAVFGSEPEGPDAPKPEGPKARKPDEPKMETVSPTIHISKATLGLLRRVATGRSLVDGKRPSISRVIEDLVDRHRADLEAEALQVRD